MKKYIFILFFIFLYFLDAKVIIQKYKLDNGDIEFELHNQFPYHITLNYNAKARGVKVSRKLPFTITLAPNSSKKVFTIRPISNTLSFKSNYSWIMGDMNAKHDNNYLYTLPFEVGKTYRISQGYNGKFSHQGDSKFAVDFDLKKGSKVYAARQGYVVEIKYDSNQGGRSKNYLEHANFITIRHDDNTYATYAHLQQNGVVVSVGDFVAKGELIGFSGNTGYSTAPHLHIIVFKAKNAKKRESIPIKFKTEKGILTNPTTGKKVTAVR